MSIISIICVVAYCLVAGIFFGGMLEEMKKDKDLDLSPLFVKTSIFLCALFWPLLILIAFIKACQK